MAIGSLGAAQGGMRRDADTVVSDRKEPILPFLLGPRRVRAASLAGVMGTDAPLSWMAAVGGVVFG